MKPLLVCPRPGILLCCALLFSAIAAAQSATDLAASPPRGVETRWSTPENPTGAAGAGNGTNRGAKGHAWDALPPHASLTLLQTSGPGQVNRIKLTLQDRSPAMLRALRLEIFWDGAAKPAVSSPLGDFFGTAFGQSPAFENAYMADPEGRSYMLALPMPFRRGARVVITNDGEVKQSEIYWEVDWQHWSAAPPPGTLYLHAYWHRAQPPVGEDFDILPRVMGHGRYLGAVVGIHANPVYTLPGRTHDPGTFWWGEGEVRMFLDGDGGALGSAAALTGRAAAEAHPTLAGTGAEDYFGTAWGLAHFTTHDAGCTVANTDLLLWSCYRFHGPDPVYFHSELRVAVQQIGGGPIAEVREMARAGAPMEPVAVDGEHFTRLLDLSSVPALESPQFPAGWVLYRRSDDWCATAFFYLDSPTDDLPPLQPMAERAAP